MASDKTKLDKLCEGLDLNLKSVKPNENSKCLVRFHNCTNLDVTLHWINFDGWPKEYPTLKPQQSISIDTHASHLWFFRAFIEGDKKMQVKNVFAISAESLDSRCNATNYNYEPIVDKNDLQRCYRDPSVCAMCRHVLRTFGRKPITVPCHHYSGKARLSSTDLRSRPHSDYYPLGGYIYTCSDDTHHRDHSLKRRDFYLVKSFYNLRERCFLEVAKEIRGEKIIELNLPTTIIRNYIQFISALEKLNEKG